MATRHSINNNYDLNTERGLCANISRISQWRIPAIPRNNQFRLASTASLICFQIATPTVANNRSRWVFPNGYSWNTERHAMVFCLIPSSKVFYTRDIIKFVV